jgi:hypothetical protein
VSSQRGSPRQTRPALRLSTSRLKLGEGKGKKRQRLKTQPSLAQQAAPSIRRFEPLPCDLTITSVQRLVGPALADNAAVWPCRLEAWQDRAGAGSEAGCKAQLQPQLQPGKDALDRLHPLPHSSRRLSRPLLLLPALQRRRQVPQSSAIPVRP